MRAAAGLIAAAALAAAAPASAQKADEVKRGDFTVLVKAQGTVLTEDVFRLKSTIEGRVEVVQASSFTWSGPRDSLGFLANTELAAMLDARSTTSSELLQERWQRVFKPTPIHCPQECFVLKVFARPKLWVQPEAVLVEAASRLRLSGRVRPGDARWLKDGQILQYWPKSDPKRKQEGRIEGFVLDVQGNKVDPAGTFTVLLDPKHYLDPGTPWEGRIVAVAKKNSLSVPTSSLLLYNGEVYLPVRVSTGITTYDYTEILAGTVEKQRFLMLEPGKAAPLQRFLPPSGLPP
ncbi:MAG TPA: hypothetical protein VNI01_05885, partial [Elusimicrobiota bacterium]|nr:hypothetical protein [Elusimicrobiota bacterium]